MRFVEISLEKYGCYAQRSIPIPDGPGLTVIYGPNEAGKSTCLEAISDFLFGVPGQSSRGAVFGYPSMRIDAVMHLANGETLSLRRRKGNARTLTDEKGVVCDDTLLASTALGAINRDRFERLFGLNHRTLRSGGNDMLAAGGEIGNLIVEAGGGLRAMVKRIEAIDQEAKSLFARTASQDRKFYRARKEFDDADRRAKDHLLSRDAYEQARGTATEAKKAADTFREERDRLRAEVNVLDRVVRVAPHLVLRNRFLVDSVAFSDTADYPGEFSKRVGEAIEARDATEDALQSAVAKRDEAKRKLDRVSVSDSLADAGNRILDLVEAAIRISGARENRQKRLDDLDVTSAKLHPLRAMLGVSPDVDVAGILPAREAIDRVAAMAAEAAREAAVLEAAEARVEELEDEIAELDKRIAEGRKRGYDRPLGVSVAQFGSLVVQKAALDARRKVAEERKKAVDNEVVWFLVPDADTLSATSCPSADDVRNENTAREAIRDDFAEQERIKRKADTEVAAILEEIAALEAGGAVPTSAAVAYAREARSRLWRPIREAFVEGKANGTVETRSDVADAFENGLETADGISDRRTDEASRVASLTELERRLRVARQEADGAEREVAELARRLAGRVDAFAAAYPDLAQRFPSLPQLIEFATRRKELLERVNVDRIEAVAIGVETNKLAPVIDLMERTEAKLGLTQSTNFAARVEALQEAIAEYETGVAEIKRDRKNQEDKAAKLKTATTNRDGARTWKASWCLQWPSAMKALRAPPSATPAEGSKLAAEWREASGILSTLTEIGTRLKKMDEDEVKLSEEVLKTSQEVGIETPHDAVAGARMLKAQWDGNEKRRTERDGLKKDYDAAEAAAEAAKAGVEAAHEVVAGLAARIGIGADGLREGASRFDQRAAIEKDIRDAERAAMTAGDQMPVAELDKEWAGREIDAVRLDLEKAKSRLNEIDYDVEQAILRGRDGREALEKFMDESEVSEAAALRENAAAEMQDALERYLELSVASDLIGEAMAAVRAELQDPLIKRAAVLFGGMTEGEYSGIEADVDDRGAPVVKGRRANGETESVATLSEGTRDQLFLAFRLASLERYGASAESLPFVADDILVHFDDARAKATLKLLSEFGEHNQVLLFTHHESVHDAAAELQKRGIANVVRLERAA